MDQLLQKEITCKMKLHILQILNKLRLDDDYKREKAVEDLMNLVSQLDDDEIHTNNLSKNEKNKNEKNKKESPY